MLNNILDLNLDQVDAAGVVVSEENAQLVLRCLEINFALEARMVRVKKPMTAEEFAKLLQRIGKIETEVELGDIMHETAENRILHENMYEPFRRGIEARLSLLKEKKLLCSDCTSHSDRALYIARNKHNTDPRICELVQAVGKHQAEVTKNMTYEQINHTADLLPAYNIFNAKLRREIVARSVSPKPNF